VASTWDGVSGIELVNNVTLEAEVAKPPTTHWGPPGVLEGGPVASAGRDCEDPADPVNGADVVDVVDVDVPGAFEDLISKLTCKPREAA
jgi:hypothetical protein